MNPNSRMHKSSLSLLTSLGLALLTQQVSAQQAAAPPARLTDITPLETLVKAPTATIRNSVITVQIYLPDAKKGFYRGVRFDWAGVIGSLTYRGHDFYVPWFRGMSPSVRDIQFQDGVAIAGPNTATTGPVEEFNMDGGALGYAEAKADGTFLKIGVGTLRKLDDAAYTFMRQFPLVDAGKRKTTVKKDRIEFTHEAADRTLGYAYHYTKTLRLEPNQPVMVIEHVLRNTGKKPINTSVYNHNFLNIDGVGTTAGLELRPGFTFKTETVPDASLAEISNNRVIYKKNMTNEQRVQTVITGFGDSAADNSFHIYSRGPGAGLTIKGNQPLTRALLWSIRPVMAIEPFVKMSIAPGETFKWSYRYTYEAG